MKKLPLARLAVAVAGAGLLLSAGAGLSSAEPDLGPLVDSPCTYDQAIAAVHAENPMAAQYLD
nr:hemophore-related protein [Streptomyces sp. DSM 41633]